MTDDEVKMVIIVNGRLEMTVGKIATQVGHAVDYCLQELFAAFIGYDGADQDAYTDLSSQWNKNDRKKIILRIDDELEFKKYLPNGDIGKKIRDYKGKPGFTTIVVRVEDLTDVGLTETLKNPVTCIGIGPQHSNIIDHFTRSLKSL